MATLQPGDRLGPYEVVSAIGRGGMGEVYRATDVRLKREVAIKVLPAEVAADADRLARFRREAEVLASLNHPNIAGIYGVVEGNDEAGDATALILELVEGATLADRIAEGAVPLDEARAVARQIAEALEAAHDAGVIHRDLKPANIKLRPDGTVKVLDFGLAKALTPAATSASQSMSPTITTPAQTMQGTILGTAAYMSPEQARGRPVDRRADIWAFGAVLFEMLTGSRAFNGDDVTETIAAVVRGEPDWDRLPPDLSPTLRVYLERCLHKDAKDRVGDIRDVRLALQGAFETPAGPATAVEGARVAATTPMWRRLLPLAATAVVMGVAAGVAGRLSAPADPRPVIRATHVLPAARSLNIVTSQIVAIAPGGERFAYLAPGPTGPISLREIDSLDDQPLAIDSVGVVAPFFSPDGRSLGYLDTAGYQLKRVSITGGPSRVIAPIGKVLFPSGVTWEADGRLLYAIDDGIWRVSADGGDPERLVAIEPGDAVYGPRLLPGGDQILFTLSPSSRPDRWDEADIVVQSLASGERRAILSGGSDARYLPTGHLVYASGNTLYAVPFDLDRLAATGRPVPVVEDVGRPADNSGGAFYAVSPTGTLVYVPGIGTSAGGTLTWVGVLDGQRTGLEVPEGTYAHPRISPDGRWLAFERQQGPRTDVWIYELSGATAMRRLTEGGDNRYPLWSGDGSRIVFQSDRDGDRGLFWQRADGTGPAERITTPEPNTFHVPEDWSPTDDRLAFSVQRDRGVELWLWNQADRSSARFGAVASAGLMNTAFSPDGQWLAYTLRGGAAGVVSLYVASVSAPDTRFQVGQEGDVNHHPLWAPDGTRLYFFSVSTPMAVAITTAPRFGIGRPAPLAGLAVNVSPQTELNHDIAPDGSRFVTVALADADAQTQQEQIVTVYNWFEELTRLVPTE